MEDYNSKMGELEGETAQTEEVEAEKEAPEIEAGSSEEEDK